jgi:hypothetical protein
VEVSIAVGLSLKEFDFVVGSFEGSGRDGVVVPVENTFAVGLQRAGDRLYASKLKVLEDVEDVVRIERGLEAFVFGTDLGGGVSA